MSILIETLRKELKKNADAKTKLSSERFFKDVLKIYGLKSADTNRIGKEFYKTISSLSKEEIFALCNELWQSGYLEETLIACEWTYRVRKKYVPNDLKLFEKWIDNYINNWASCDTFCNHTVGEFIEMYPQYISVLKKWTASKNRWMRRATAVSLIVPARKGLFLQDIFEIATILLTDKEDMVQKGYGWMLKVASQAHEKEVFDFVMKHKAVMPRTALRYAIEKMPKELKQKAMN